MYVERYHQEVCGRPILALFKKAAKGFGKVCFLCAEESPEHCHRWLLAEYIHSLDDSVEIEHL